MNIEEQIYKMVTGIPKGKVTTYGRIAKAVGIGPRQIGRVLHNNPDNKTIPCHRVVHSDGSVASGYAFGGPVKQIKMLLAEGVRFRGNKVMREDVI